MAGKSKLAEILGVEEDEEFTIKGECATYRIHNGKRECKHNVDGWYTCGFEKELIELINDPSLIQKKPRFTDEEMTVLRWLHKHGNLEYLCKGLNGKPYADTIGNFGLALNVADYLLKPGESVDLNEMFGSITDEDRGR